MTGLLFLWDPLTHMFLNPETTKDLAEGFGHRSAQSFSSWNSLSVCERLLDLGSETGTGIADLEPADRFDIQSFMWSEVNLVPESKAVAHLDAGPPEYLLIRDAFRRGHTLLLPL